MHGGTLTRESLPAYSKALKNQEFAYRGRLLGRPVDEAAQVGLGSTASQ